MLTRAVESAGYTVSESMKSCADPSRGASVSAKWEGLSQQVVGALLGSDTADNGAAVGSLVGSDFEHGLTRIGVILAFHCLDSIIDSVGACGEQYRQGQGGCCEAFHFFFLATGVTDISSRLRLQAG